MEMNVIDAWKQEKGLTDVEAVNEIKSMGFSDEVIALFRKTNSEVTDEERQSLSKSAAEKTMSEFGLDEDQSIDTKPKRITIDLIELGNGYKSEFESDFSNSETRSIFINIALSVLKDMDIDVSSVEKQLEPLIKK